MTFTKYSFKNNFLLFISFIFIATACSSTKSSSSIVNETLNENENTLLWSLEYPDSDIQSYLYGTIHLIPKKDLFISKELQAALEKVDEVTFEVDMAEMEDPTVIFSLMNKMMMPENITLSSLVSPEDYKTIQDKLSSFGLPAIITDKIKPIFLSVIIEQSNMGQGMNQEDFASFELVLNERAKKAKKTTSGLETLAYQMSIFDSIPIKEQANFLVKSLNNEEGGNEDMNAMVELYKKRDLVGLTKMVNDSDEGMDMDALLGNRNNNWVPIIMSQLKSKTHLYAVGAAHLSGPKGVISLLRNQGIVVSPIMETLTLTKEEKMKQNAGKMKAPQYKEGDTPGN